MIRYRSANDNIYKTVTSVQMSNSIDNLTRMLYSTVKSESCLDNWGDFLCYHLLLHEMSSIKLFQIKIDCLGIEYAERKRILCRRIWLSVHLTEAQHAEEHLVFFGFNPSLNINEKKTEIHKCANATWIDILRNQQPSGLNMEPKICPFIKL